MNKKIFRYFFITNEMNSKCNQEKNYRLKLVYFKKLILGMG